MASYQQTGLPSSSSSLLGISSSMTVFETFELFVSLTAFSEEFVACGSDGGSCSVVFESVLIFLLGGASSFEFVLSLFWFSLVMEGVVCWDEGWFCRLRFGGMFSTKEARKYNALDGVTSQSSLYVGSTTQKRFDWASWRHCC